MMGIYTVLGDHRIDQVIQGSLDRIVEEVYNLMGDYIRAIILTGGFGKGEGGVTLKNGHYRPVNDFDISVVISKNYFYAQRRFKKSLVELAEKMAHETGVKQIDIGISHILRYRFAPNLIRFYEVKNGYKVLYGKIDLKKIMPSLPAKKLLLIDGAIYFLSRGSGLLISALYFLPEYRVEPRNRENFIIELDKACLAMGDAFLLLRKQYHYSYQERLQRVAGMPFSDVPAGKTVQKLYLEAAKRKLYPQFEWIGDKEMIRKWFEIRGLFSEFFLWFESQRFHKKFSSWNSYTQFIKKRNRIFFLGLPNPKSLVTMPTLLFSLKKDISDKELSNWIAAARIYLKSFHPEGVVAELTKENNK